LDAFCKGAYTHIFADSAVTNTFAIKAYEKAGFKREKHHEDTDEMWMIRESKQPIGNQCVSTKTAPHFRWGDGCDGWWLKKSVSFTVIEEIMPAGASEIRHFHQRTEQFFYILEGALILELDGVEHPLKSGDSIVVPPCMPHRVFNHDSQNVRFLVVSCPDSHEDRIDLKG
jgi:mannose-6-phosphate isomerase-like protein (cupin superfamily)